MTDETLAAAACALAVTADLACSRIIGHSHRLHHARDARTRMAPYLLDDIRQSIAELQRAADEIELALAALKRREAA